MNKLFTAAFCFVAATIFGASPDFRNFNPTQFGTQALNITLRSGALATNLVLQGTATGNGSGITNVPSPWGIDSLAAANVINVTNFGAVPYIPGVFVVGSFPTNAVDNSVALSNAFRFASNCIAPRVVYFPPGIYRFTNTLTVPPLTSIRGEGWLHQGGAGSTRVLTGPTVATNNFSVLWYMGPTNGTALRVPYHANGPQTFEKFEVCGGTNAMADLGAGYTDPSSLQMLADTNRGYCGINFDAHTYGGGFKVKDVTVTGFQIGINHAGNFCFYEHCNFNGNNIGMLSTNDYAPDQVIVRMCSIGNRQGGIGYWLARGRGWIIEDPSDIDYYAFAVLVSQQLTVIGGNSEANGTVPPTSTFFQASSSVYYQSNSWPYVKKTPFIVGRQTDMSRNTIIIMGGQYSGVDRDGLISSYRPINTQNAITVMGTIWDTTNVFAAGQSVVVPMLYMAEAYQEDAPVYVGSSTFPVAAVEEYIGFASAPRYTYTVGPKSMVPPTEVQLSFANIYNGGPAASSTNLNLFRFGQFEHQFGTTTTPDWLQIQMATNWTAAGRPNIGRFRVPTSDFFPVPANGQPNTNFTFQEVKVTTFTNLGTAYIPTNAAPFTIITADFALNTIYTNRNQRAYVSSGFGMAVSGGQGPVVGLYLDQDGNGSFEQTGKKLWFQPVEGACTNEIGAFLQPNARFVFTNVAGVGVLSVSPGSAQWVFQ